MVFAKRTQVFYLGLTRQAQHGPKKLAGGN